METPAVASPEDFATPAGAEPAGAAPATPPASLLGLRVFNFFSASLQTGYGPLLPVYLARAGWTQGDVGFALSLGSIAGVVSQVPAGLLVDHITQRRLACAVALGALAAGLVLLASWPGHLPVFFVLILQGFAGAMLAPAIAALTFCIGGHAAFGEHVGRNQRYASVGNAGTAALLGLIAYHFSVMAAFLFSAALLLPALLCLTLVRVPACPPPAQAPHPALLPAEQRDARFWHVFFSSHMHVFAICVTLFTLANAAMLPLALNALAHRSARAGDIAATGSIIALQAVVFAVAPSIGALAERIGRRPVLLFGFACLPVRALLLTLDPGPYTLVAIELLDGAAASVMGVMIPLMAADLTRQNGYLNLAIGSFGLAASLGATISTTLAGWIADFFGLHAAFLFLALPGALAMLVMVLFLPEMRRGVTPPGSGGSAAPQAAATA